MAAKTTADKLLIKPRTTVWVSDPARLSLLGSLPPGASTAPSLDGATAAVVFADDAASLRALAAEHSAGLATTELVWVAYPKGNRTDINRDSVWPILAEHGFRPIGQVALDETWSALRFRPLREGEAQFTGGR